jgi:predicted ATPase
VPQAVARRACALLEQPGQTLLDRLLAALQERQLLLVLDNCEHLLSACAGLSELLLANTAVTVLTTSREPLGVRGEMLYPVRPPCRSRHTLCRRMT